MLKKSIYLYILIINFYNKYFFIKKRREKSQVFKLL